MSIRTAPESVSDRLDGLPFTRRHLRILTGSGVGWALDAMDVGLISFVIAVLAQQWILSGTETSLIASAGFLGMAVGASLGGLLADRIGRRSVFAVTLLVYGLATGASALVGGVAALLVLRFIVGLGLGAELPVASTYVSELAPAKIRGRVIVVLEAFWAVGWTAAALIGYFVIPASENGWRWAFALGALPAAYALVVRWGLPESARWLERRGRAGDAETVVRSFEASPALFRRGGTPVAPPAATGTVEGSRVRAGIAALWSPEFRLRTACLWLVWFCVNFSYYGAFIWIPSILVAQGYDLVRSFGFTLIITLAQLPGYAAAAWLIEVWGRRVTLSVFLVGSAVAAVLFGTATSEAAVIATGMALSFFNLGAWGALYAITPETYPTSVRATGAGWAAGVGRIASIIAPLAVPPLLALGGAPVLFVVFAAFFAVAAAGAWGLSDRRGRALDDR
ncbi:putative MFS transporter [Microbacterium sp. SLBN-154]|uniref:MFS transporter n=1 Tax=Microbacterium sp. SLBN-154 TaxID=2768458 RepID=UPI0011724406|nr:MFS transporter [Microbacterium sp. SLBN-154]TQK19606.1 putative MFS transporter [Microbacterium sp. SLBN-154]